MGRIITYVGSGALTQWPSKKMDIDTSVKHNDIDAPNVQRDFLRGVTQEQQRNRYSDSDFSMLAMQIQSLGKEVAELKTIRSEVSELKVLIKESLYPFDDEDQGIIELRDITFHQAKDEIRKFFSENHGKKIDAADIQDMLGIDIDLAIDVLEVLREEGKIK